MNTDWLKQLAPAHAPPPVGWWPLAPGWWGLGALVLLALAAALWWYRQPRRRTRRAALAEFKRLESAAHDDQRLAHALEHLLRRYALARYGREQVAGLGGEAWLAFLVAHGGTVLGGEPGASLLRAAYGSPRPPAQGDRSRWLQGAHDFIRSRK
jgi:hypothetical protein